MDTITFAILILISLTLFAFGGFFVGRMYERMEQLKNGEKQFVDNLGKAFGLDLPTKRPDPVEANSEVMHRVSLGAKGGGKILTPPTPEEIRKRKAKEAEDAFYADLGSRPKRSGVIVK